MKYSVSQRAHIFALGFYYYPIKKKRDKIENRVLARNGRASASGSSRGLVPAVRAGRRTRAAVAETSPSRRAPPPPNHVNVTAAATVESKIVLLFVHTDSTLAAMRSANSAPPKWLALVRVSHIVSAC